MGFKSEREDRDLKQDHKYDMCLITTESRFSWLTLGKEKSPILAGWCHIGVLRHTAWGWRELCSNPFEPRPRDPEHVNLHCIAHGLGVTASEGESEVRLR